MASARDIAALAARLPKAELHLHLEGSLEPEQLFQLAARNGVTLPYACVEAARAAYDFGDLQDFLDLYYRGMSVLQQERDFYELTDAYLRRAQADNVRHAELFFDPQGHTARGIPFAAVADGILAALADGERSYGITSRLILCFLRHLSEEAAFAALAEAEPWLDRIAGVGLDSGERGNPPSLFQRVFAAARARGLHCVAHAGEEGPADYVRQALDLLRAERIDHGIHALDDAALVARLARQATTLTVCPLSNVRLRVVPDMASHPLKRMLQLGLSATVNADDPAYFGGYVNANFRAAVEALDLTAGEVVTLCQNSFRGSFLPAAAIDRHLASIAAAAGPAFPAAGESG